jgi:PAS domain S-box-containing protein
MVREDAAGKRTPKHAAGSAEASALWDLCPFLIEAAPLPMAALEGPEHLVREVNPAFCRLLDTAREALVGRRFAEAVPAWEGAEPLLDRVYCTGEAASHAGAVGSDRRWSGVAWPVFGADARPIGVIIQAPETSEAAHFRDELTAMNQALIVSSVRQHERTDAAEALTVRVTAEKILLHTILDQAADGITVRDTTGKLLFANAAAQRLAGGPPTGTALHEAPAIWGETFDPAGTLLAVETWPISRALQGETVQAVEWRRVRSDGRQLVVLNSAAPLKDPTGTIFGAVSITTDITERKRAEEALRESEERLRLATAAANEGIWDWDVGHDTVRWNETYARLLGRPDTGTSVRWWIERLHPEDRDRVVTSVRRAFETGQSWVEEYRFRLPNGEYAHILDRAVTALDQTGRPRRVVGAMLDLTAQKLAEAALRQAHDVLERRVQERTAELSQRASQLQALTAELAIAEDRERQQLGQVLHDGLQQLLVAAQMRVRLLERAKDLAMVRKGCRELMALLAQALASSRSLTAELSPAVLHHAGLLPALEWLATWMRETHHLAVECTTHEAVSVEDEAMKVLLFQSVRELLFNVVKHAKVDRARLDIGVGNGAVQIVVADAGVGIDPTQLRPVGAGGLGLVSIRQRLEYLGGNLEIVSAPGQGSRFTLRVPIQPPA